MAVNSVIQVLLLCFIKVQLYTIYTASLLLKLVLNCKLIIYLGEY